MSNFLPNFLIGLREGLEAGLVVSILVAYLVKTNRRDALKWVAAGVAVAVVVSFATGAALTFGVNTLTFEAQEAVGGTLSIIAVAFVTYMIFWMKRASRTMKASLQGKLEGALAMGTTAVALTSLLAVGREGLETAFFVWSTVESAGGSTVGPLVGALSGIAVAVVIAYFLYRGALKINLAKFFKYTGVALIIVAAGVLAYGVHDLQEASILPGLNTVAFDATNVWSASSWFGTLLKATLNISPVMTVLECAVWLTYFVVVLTLFLKPTSLMARAPRPVATHS